MRATVFALMMLGSVAGCAGDLRMSVRFLEADGFKPGDPVFYDNRLIGRIEQVRIQEDKTFLDLRIEEREPKIRSSAKFGLKTKGIFGGGKRAVVLHDPGQGDPVPSGGEVRGYTRAELAMSSLRAVADTAVQQVRGVLADARKSIQNPEAQAFLDRLQSVAQEGGEAMARFKEQAPKFQKELEALGKKLRAAGQSEQAKALEKAYKSVLDAE